jgi:4-hydroxy-3-methylbut-2-enyl diphosphate reductase
VSGKKSSNGKVLYNVCKEVNPATYFISDENEVKDHWLENIKTVGICGATSTPMWLMEKVKEHISNRQAISN